MSNNDGAGEALLFVTATIWNGRLLPETKNKFSKNELKIHLDYYFFFCLFSQSSKMNSQRNDTAFESPKKNSEELRGTQKNSEELRGT